MFWGESAAPGLPMRRIYDSAGVSGYFGNGWTSLFDRWLKTYQDFVVLGTETDERFIFENYNHLGTFIQIHPQTVTPSTLTFDGSNYTLRNPSEDIVRVFRAADGRLISYQSRSTGRIVTVTYTAGRPSRVDDSLRVPMQGGAKVLPGPGFSPQYFRHRRDKGLHSRMSQERRCQDAELYDVPNLQYMRSGIAVYQ